MRSNCCEFANCFIYASWGTTSYKEVVMHLVTNLKIVNFVKKFNYAIDPLVLTYSTVVHCYHNVYNIYMHSSVFSNKITSKPK